MAARDDGIAACREFHNFRLPQLVKSRGQWHGAETQRRSARMRRYDREPGGANSDAPRPEFLLR